MAGKLTVFGTDGRGTVVTKYGPGPCQKEAAPVGLNIHNANVAAWYADTNYIMDTTLPDVYGEQQLHLFKSFEGTDGSRSLYTNMDNVPVFLQIVEDVPAARTIINYTLTNWTSAPVAASVFKLPC